MHEFLKQIYFFSVFFNKAYFKKSKCVCQMSFQQLTIILQLSCFLLLSVVHKILNGILAVN